MNKMVRVKDIIISKSAPNDPRVGWITTNDRKPVLKFNINGVWKDMMKETDNPGEDVDNSNVTLYPNQTVWCSAAAEALNVTINTDGRKKSSVMSGVSYLACKPDVKTINLTAGANISIFPSGPLSLTGSGNKLVQFTFVKTSEGIAYEVYVSKLGEDF